MTDLEYIKKFSEITIRKVCQENGIATNNLYTGKCSYASVKKVRKAIEAEVAKLHIEEYKDLNKDD